MAKMLQPKISWRSGTNIAAANRIAAVVIHMVEATATMTQA
jgi:hypothetical protein